MGEVELKVGLTGLAIREYLLEVGEACPNDVLRALRQKKRRTSYNSVARYFWILRQLGLIERTRREMGRGAIPKQLYRIVPGKANDDRWGAPQIALYPETALGRSRYGK